jgi:hypothetical protein
MPMLVYHRPSRSLELAGWPGLKAASSGSFVHGLKPVAFTVVPLARH